MQSAKYCSPGNCQTRQVYWIARQRSVIGHSREHVSTTTGLESSGSWLSCCCSQLLPLCYNTTISWNIW
ncbi:unnamed protein product [Staurois parvus]|uniref:Uncharacterized protein n=1 Tax=Staurois parvus TaxID=386267 RepID=A0ABN9HAK4_9NEOB|nr:unnamed protein product [Staurois parvus]